MPAAGKSLLIRVLSSVDDNLDGNPESKMKLFKSDMAYHSSFPFFLFHRR